MHAFFAHNKFKFANLVSISIPTLKGLEKWHAVRNATANKSRQRLVKVKPGTKPKLKNSLEIFRKKNYVHDSACDMDFYIYIFTLSFSAFVSVLKSFATNRGKKLTVNNKIKDEKKTYNRE